MTWKNCIRRRKQEKNTKQRKEDLGKRRGRRSRRDEEKEKTTREGEEEKSYLSRNRNDCLALKGTTIKIESSRLKSYRKYKAFEQFREISSQKKKKKEVG